MRLFAYYSLHSIKNQIKKMLKSWVLIFLAVCVIIGIVMGSVMAIIDDSGEPEETPVEDPAEEEESFFEATGVGKEDLVELIAGGLILAMLTLSAFGADKNGSNIFLPADVNLLFASPMKPQSVLMFRLASQLGLALLGSGYMLFQLPNLTLNFGLDMWAALALVLVWSLTVAFGTLLQVLLYTLSSTFPAVKRNLRRGIYGLLAAVAAGFIFFTVKSGENGFKAAALFFNAKITRFIPIWGWLKGICAFAAAGDLTGAVLCLLALILCGGALIYIIWSIKADFYEDAMAKSEERAELMAAAQSEKSGVVIKRQKDRSERLRRDGLNHGSGANVFFFKTMYNRFRFARFGFLTKTTGVYIAAAVGVGAVCRYVVHTQSVMPTALALAALAFFRSLGNPMEQDTGMDCYLLIPESTWAKLFWSLMGGTVCCLLDTLPAMLIGAIIVGENLFTALAWVPLVISVDFYATNVGTFIGLSVPAAAGKILKQIVQVLFVYFGLMPDIIIAVFGFVSGHTAIAMIIAAIFNFGLGFAFFGLSPIFIDPKGGKKARCADADAFSGDIKPAKSAFSRLGLGAFVMLVSAMVLQLIAAGIANAVWPEGGAPEWVLWLCTFAPMYLGAIPLGLLIFRKAPAAPRESRSMKPGKVAVSAIICIFLMYAGNLLGTVILMLIESAAGSAPANPLLTYTSDSSVLLRILVMVILAPIIEEYVFRRQLIDRMSVYGEKLAVFTSALMFGLFHGNLSQFFYAFALGLAFGYIYLRTGRLRYSIGLHMFINFTGSVVAPALLERIDLDAMSTIDVADTEAITDFLSQLAPLAVYSVVMLSLAIAGLVLFCVHVRRLSFETAPQELPRGSRFKAAYLNVGMALFVALSLASIVLTFFE